MKKLDESYMKGHRKRLLEKVLENKCSDLEYLEFILCKAIPRIDVKPIAKDLVRKFKSVHNVFAAPISDLCEVRGVKENTAAFFNAVHNLMISGHKLHLEDTPVLHDYSRVSEYCKIKLSNKEVEEFHVLYLDNHHRLLEDYLHTIGTINWAMVYPREIVKQALKLNASYVILVHNHPTGNSSFSSDDIKITMEIISKLKNVDIEFFDHLVVSGSIVHSGQNLRLFD